MRMALRLGLLFSIALIGPAIGPLAEAAGPSSSGAETASHSSPKLLSPMASRPEGGTQSLAQLDPPSTQPEGTPTPPTEDATPPESPEQPAVEITGEPWTVEGRIDDRDRRDANDFRFDEYHVVLQAGQSYRISATSERIDPMLQVLEPARDRPLLIDDDSGLGLNARLDFVPEATGTYAVRVLGVFPDLTGEYGLRIEVPRPFSDPIAIALDPTFVASPASTVWIPVDGELAPTDDSLDGLHFDDYLVTLAPGDEMLMRLDSEAFDPVVRIFRADDRIGNQLVGDNDSGAGNGSLLLFRPADYGAAEPADFIIRVASTSPSAVGVYRLRLGR